MNYESEVLSDVSGPSGFWLVATSKAPAAFIMLDLAAQLLEIQISLNVAIEQQRFNFPPPEFWSTFLTSSNINEALTHLRYTGGYNSDPFVINEWTQTWS